MLQGSDANRAAGLLLHVFSAVIAREGGQSSIPEAAAFSREVAAYWMPRLRGG